jgi:VCBS repeat-containing protein
VPGTELTGQYGIITINNDGSFTYIPNHDSVIKLDQSDIGRDIFSYTISDDSLSTSTGRLTILITGSNNPPEVQTDTIKIQEGAESVFFSSLLSNDYDPEGKNLSITKVNNTTENQFIDNWGEIRWSTNGDITYIQNNISTDYLKEGQILDLQYQYSVTDGQMGKQFRLFHN